MHLVENRFILQSLCTPFNSSQSRQTKGADYGTWWLTSPTMAHHPHACNLKAREDSYRVEQGIELHPAAMRLGRAQILEGLTENSQRRWRLCRIVAQVLPSNRGSTPVRRIWAVFELSVQRSNTTLSLLRPSAAPPLGPSSVIHFVINQ